ncbi:MAG: hypothetical protein Sapg2KO_13950 [Saprospiraceae bacterium]
MALLPVKNYLPEIQVDQNPLLQSLLNNVDRRQINQVLSSITDQSGARLMGTQNYLQALQQVEARLKTYGFSEVHKEAFGENLRSWDLKRFNLELSAPVYQNINAFPQAYVEGVNGSIEAPVLVVPDASQLVDYQDQLAGKIVAIGNQYSPQSGVSTIALWRKKLSREQLQRAADNRDPNDQQLGYYSKRSTLAAIANKKNLYQHKDSIQTFLRKAGALAILEASSAEFGLLQVDGWGFTPAYYSSKSPKALPSFVIENEVFGRLIRLQNNGITPTMNIQLEATFPDTPERHQNLIVELPGTNPDLSSEVVIMGAHLDSWHSSLGVTDNAVNCAVLIEALRILKAIDFQPDRTIRLILWGGHEQNFQGSRSYLEQHIGALDGSKILPAQQKVSAYYNLDNGAGKIRGAYLMGNTSAIPFLRPIVNPFEESKTLTLQYANQSDHELFDWLGIPGFQMIQDPLSYIPVTHHTNQDYQEYFSIEDQEYNALFMAYLVAQTANAETLFPRKIYHHPQPIMDGKTRIRLEGHQEAQTVSLFADFNNWNLYGTKLKRVDGGWECWLDLPKGRHLYKYIIDGDYIAPPHTKKHFRDDNGHAGLAELVVD